MQAHKKVCNENERKKEKQCKHKNVIDGRKNFIGCIRKTNLDQLRINDSEYNEGTICFEWVPRGWFIKCGCMNGPIKLAMAGT